MRDPAPFEWPAPFSAGSDADADVGGFAVAAALFAEGTRGGDCGMPGAASDGSSCFGHVFSPTGRPAEMDGASEDSAPFLLIPFEDRVMSPTCEPPVAMGVDSGLLPRAPLAARGISAADRLTDTEGMDSKGSPPFQTEPLASRVMSPDARPMALASEACPDMS